MRKTEGLKVVKYCENCEKRSDDFFCSLPNTSRKNLETLKVTNSYESKAQIYTEGQKAKGVYMLCQGRVKLSTCSNKGKSMVLRIAEPGEILGLSAVVGGTTYETSAHAVTPCQVNFYCSEEFLGLMRRDSNLSIKIVKQLNNDYLRTFGRARSFGLTLTAREKFARLLLEWAKDDTSRRVNGSAIIDLPFTHQEIGEMIGTSRETVTRMINEFKDRNLISKKGNLLTIEDVGSVAKVGSLSE